jgi:Uso1 / p115 like vesicle tethering protein, head region
MENVSSSEDAAQQLTHWMVLCDRLLSSSTSDDVTVTLHSIYDRLNAVGKQKENAELLSEMIEMMVLSEEKKTAEESSPILATLLRIFATSYHLQIEDGTVDVGRIYVFLFHHANLRTASALLQSGELISGCIDVATSTTIPEYGRVLALQILQRAGQVQPSTVQQQLLATPNGIARLGDLFSLSDTPEQVQTALLQCTVAGLSQWASVAKIWIFHDILDAILKIAVQQEGGLASSLKGGNAATVLDCITAVQQLLSHDTSMAELVFSSAQSMVVTSLCQLLDLRNASRFRNPTPTDKTTPGTSLSSSQQADAVDDLDDLIAAASSQNRTNDSSSKDTAAQEPVDDRIVPLLTDLEEQIIDKVLDVLATVLENDAVRNMIWKQHAALGNLLWEMALLTKPPSPTPYPCGIPSVRLQQRALQVVATYFHSITILEEQLFAGMDRLFYLVCTGMGGAVASVAGGEDTYRISQSALYVVRRTIPDAMKNDMLMHALAPPPVDDPTQPLPASLSVVPKLLRTILDQLTTTTATTNPVSLSGALGAVAVFIQTSEVQRSILFRLTSNNIADDTTSSPAGTPSSLLNAMLDALITELDATNTTPRLEVVAPLLRFLCTWIMDTPELVQVFLNASSTLVLSQRLLSSPQHSSSSSGQDMIQALISVLFGVCLMALPAQDDATEGGGGWTRANVVLLLQHPAIIAGLERVKTMPPPRVPWSFCTDEWKVWLEWYSQVVRAVRQRMVQEMLQRPDQVEGGHVEDTTWHGVVTEEAEQLRTELLESKRIIAAQGKSLFFLFTFCYVDVLPDTSVIFILQKSNWRLGSNGWKVRLPNWITC